MEFFKGVIVLSMAIAGSVMADEYEFLRKSQAVIDQAGEAKVPHWLNPYDKAMNQYGNVVKGIHDSASEHVGNEMGFVGDLGDRSIARRLAFISFGIPSQELKLILEMAGEGRVTVVLRGLPKGIRTLPELIKTMKALTESIDSSPEIILDPELFKSFDVEYVPTYINVTEEGGSTRAEGNVAFSYIDRVTEKNKDKDLGRVGSIWTIEEKDFIEEMKERMGGIDFAGKAEESYRDFWKKRTFMTLTKAEKYRRFTLSPEFKVNREINTPKGVLPFKVGSFINPLEHFNFNQKLIIFNPMDLAEKAFAKYLMEGNPYAMEKIIVTQVDQERGWDHLKELEEEFGRQVYLLQENLAGKFKIRATPSTVYAEDLRFVIEEFGPVEIEAVINDSH